MGVSRGMIREGRGKRDRRAGRKRSRGKKGKDRNMIG